jgi:hypothetical protein
MAADGVVDIVVVERVAGGAIDDSRLERRHAAVGAHKQRRTRAAVRDGYFFGDARRCFVGACESTGDGVDDGDFRPVHRVGGKSWYRMAVMRSAISVAIGVFINSK